MRITQRIFAIAIMTVAGRAGAGPIDLDPYIPPTVRAEVVRGQLEKAQEQDQQSAGNVRGQRHQTRPVSKRAHAREDSGAARNAGRQK